MDRCSTRPKTDKLGEFIRYLLSTVIVFILNPVKALGGEWVLGDADKSWRHFAESNNKGFWSSIDESIELKLSPFLEHQGWLVGDPHIKNFSPFFWQNQWWWLASDFDDVGYGPFVFDLLRLLSTSRDLSELEKEEVIDKYRLGLCGQAAILPSWLLSILKQDSPWNKDVDFTKQKFARGEREFFPIGRVLKQGLKNHLPPGEWLDGVITHRERGGSREQPRYWVLLKSTSGAIHHYEFKQLAPSALSLYQQQSAQVDLLEQSKRYYWPSDNVVSHRVISLGENSFLLRQRTGKWERLKRAYKNPSRALSLHHLTAQELGFRHGQQDPNQKLCQQLQQPAMEEKFYQAILASGQDISYELSTQYQQQKVKKQSYELFGDVRFRLQNRKREEMDPRFQQKIRSRFGAEFFVSESFSSRFSVSTGRSPTSANANLGDGFSYKSFGIHEASITYEPVDHAQLSVGKMDLPFVVYGDSEIMWDNTLTPEGVALKWQHSHGLIQPFFNSGYFLLSENYRKKRGINQPDHMLFVAQLGVDMHWRNWRWSIAGGPVRYSQVQGSRFKDISEGEALGNSDDGDKRYLYDYHLHELAMEISYQSTATVTFFAHGVENSEGEENQAFRWGGAVEYAQLEFLGAYRRVEKDSVFGFFTESNFAFGGTDQKGYEANLRWKPQRNFFITLSHHWSQQGVRDKIDQMKRFHLDFTARF
jgi:hypothetical protein